MVSTTKDPLKVRAGQISAAKRWGTSQATVRIDDLQPAVRAAVLALIRANEAAKKAVTSPHEATAQEVSSASSNTTAQRS